MVACFSTLSDVVNWNMGQRKDGHLFQLLIDQKLNLYRTNLRIGFGKNWFQKNLRIDLVAVSFTTSLCIVDKDDIIIKSLNEQKMKIVTINPLMTMTTADCNMVRLS